MKWKVHLQTFFKIILYNSYLFLLGGSFHLLTPLMFGCVIHCLCAFLASLHEGLAIGPCLSRFWAIVLELLLALSLFS